MASATFEAPGGTTGNDNQSFSGQQMTLAVRAGWGMAVGEASAGFDDRAVDRSSVTRAKGNIGHGSAENISRVGKGGACITEICRTKGRN